MAGGLIRNKKAMAHREKISRCAVWLSGISVLFAGNAARACVALPLFFQYHIFFAQQAGQLLQQDGLRINPPALRRPYHTAGIGKADVYRQRPLKYP